MAETFSKRINICTFYGAEGFSVAARISNDWKARLEQEQEQSRSWAEIELSRGSNFPDDCICTKLVKLLNILYKQDTPGQQHSSLQRDRLIKNEYCSDTSIIAIVGADEETGE